MAEKKSCGVAGTPTFADQAGPAKSAAQARPAIIMIGFMRSPFHSPPASRIG
jgi:hypothetical protein